MSWRGYTYDMYLFDVYTDMYNRRYYPSWWNSCESNYQTSTCFFFVRKPNWTNLQKVVHSVPVVALFVNKVGNVDIFALPFSGGSRISQGAPTPKVGAPVYFSRKLHEKERNWSQREGAAPFRSATAINEIISEMNLFQCKLIYGCIDFKQSNQHQEVLPASFFHEATAGCPYWTQGTLRPPSE